MSSPLVSARSLAKRYAVRRGALQRTIGWVEALAGVDLDIESGECYALVGESGSGKTTLGRCLVRLEEPTAGRVLFDGVDLTELTGSALRRQRRHFQYVFQDPYASLNPRMRVGTAVGEPLRVHRLASRSELADRVRQLLELVGLDGEAARRFPHEFSGGQRQRIGIARALATGPRFLVADEPVSALDVSVQAEILNLLQDLRRQLGLALLFIAHDLAVVELIADRIGVLYLGRLVEEGSAVDVLTRPRHPYTTSLLSAVPRTEPDRRRHRIVLAGEIPSPVAPPTGCAFHPRCPVAQARCAEEAPRLRTGTSRHLVACHFPGELTLDGAVVTEHFSPADVGEIESKTD